MTFTSLLLVSAVAAAPAVQQPQPFQPATSTLGQRAASPLTNLQGFNIVLLVGESQSSGGSIDDVPAAARKALNDMRDFLPFKHYRVLDSQWTSCCANSGGVSISGQVQGLAASGGGFGSTDVKLYPRSYHFMLQVRPADAARLGVNFSLMPEGPSNRTPQADRMSQQRENELEKRFWELRKELDTLQDEIPVRKRTVGDKHPEVQALYDRLNRVQQRMVETENELRSGRAQGQQDARASSRPLIDGGFTMDLGETVVVGTSRLGGDKALIAIVTAVKKGAR
jgi:hypothetical protein